MRTRLSPVVAPRQVAVVRSQAARLRFVLMQQCIDTPPPRSSTRSAHIPTREAGARRCPRHRRGSVGCSLVPCPSPPGCCGVRASLRMAATSLDRDASAHGRHRPSRHAHAPDRVGSDPLQGALGATRRATPVRVDGVGWKPGSAPRLHESSTSVSTKGSFERAARSSIEHRGHAAHGTPLGSLQPGTVTRPMRLRISPLPGAPRSPTYPITGAYPWPRCMVRQRDQFRSDSLRRRAPGPEPPLFPRGDPRHPLGTPGQPSPALDARGLPSAPRSGPESRWIPAEKGTLWSHRHHLALPATRRVNRRWARDPEHWVLGRFICPRGPHASHRAGPAANGVATPSLPLWAQPTLGRGPVAEWAHRPRWPGSSSPQAPRVHGSRARSDPAACSTGHPAASARRGHGASRARTTRHLIVARPMNYLTLNLNLR